MEIYVHAQQNCNGLRQRHNDRAIMHAPVDSVIYNRCTTLEICEGLFNLLQLYLHKDVCSVSLFYGIECVKLKFNEY